MMCQDKTFQVALRSKEESTLEITPKIFLPHALHNSFSCSNKSLIKTTRGFAVQELSLPGFASQGPGHRFFFRVNVPQALMSGQTQGIAAGSPGRMLSTAAQGGGAVGRCEATLAGAAVSRVPLGSAAMEPARAVPCAMPHDVEAMQKLVPFKQPPSPLDLPGL